MATDIQIKKQKLKMKKTKAMKTVVEVVHEPGNATRYRVVALKLREGVWLVSTPFTRGCHEVPEGSELHYDYVREKFSGSGREMGLVDASEYAKCIASAVPKCIAVVRTDDQGKFVDGPPTVWR